MCRGWKTENSLQLFLLIGGVPTCINDIPILVYQNSRHPGALGQTQPMLVIRPLIGPNESDEQRKISLHTHSHNGPFWTKK